MACTGPAEVDVTWFWFICWFLTGGLGIDNLPGFPDRDGTAAIYAEIAEAPSATSTTSSVGRSRFGVIMVAIDEVMRQNGIDLGSSPSGLALAALETTRKRCRA